MTLDKLKEIIALAHKPELANKPGMVYQIWEDGEITSQKSGDLLWQRTLHCIHPACFPSLPLETMPDADSLAERKHAYAFIENKETGMELHKAMDEYWTEQKRSK